MQAEIDWAIVRESLLVVRDGIRAEIERLQARLSRVLATVMWSEAQLGIPVPEEIPVPVAEAKPAGAQRKTLRQRLVSGSRDVARRGTWPTRPDKSMAPAIGESLCSRVLAWLRSHPGVHRPDAIAVVLKARNKSVSDVCGKLAKLGEVKKAGYGEYAAVTTGKHRAHSNGKGPRIDDRASGRVQVATHTQGHAPVPDPARASPTSMSLLSSKATERTIDRAIEVLRRVGRPMSLTEIASELQLPQGQVPSLGATLRKHIGGLIARVDGGFALRQAGNGSVQPETVMPMVTHIPSPAGYRVHRLYRDGSIVRCHDCGEQRVRADLFGICCAGDRVAV